MSTCGGTVSLRKPFASWPLACPASFSPSTGSLIRLLSRAPSPSWIRFFFRVTIRLFQRIENFSCIFPGFHHAVVHLDLVVGCLPPFTRLTHNSRAQIRRETKYPKYKLLDDEMPLTLNSYSSQILN